MIKNAKFSGYYLLFLATFIWKSNIWWHFQICGISAPLKFLQENMFSSLFCFFIHFIYRLDYNCTNIY